jgi:crotonobetainyl-CoA:carnitine CoA-transferase CaiB-like acyl-CoA transferase
MPEPLEGFTVVEMAVAVQGPAAALYLRDMGAEVIKVEPPLGDASRYGRGRGNEAAQGTIGPQYVSVNRGKRSVCVDISTDEGILVVHRLLENADVFLTNYREPALVKMGLGYDDIKSRYPKLVYASVNGFGPAGPDADKAMLDGVAATRGGLVNHTGYPDRPPSLAGAIVIDTSGAMQLALGVMTALVARERYGVAQRVQTSALGAALWLQQWEITHVNMTGAELQRDGSHHGNIRGPYGVYNTKDGGAIMIAQTMDIEAWDSFCIFAEDFDLSIDPRFQTPGQRLGEGLTEEDSTEVRARLTSIFASKTTREWEDFLYTQPEIIWERARDWSEVLEDEQSIANNYVTKVDVAGVGTTKTVGNLVTLSETPGSPKGNPPQLGEANNEILGDLGFSSEERMGIETHATKVREEFIAALMGAASAATNDAE